MDVLAKNEAKHSNMLDIMKTQQAYLGRLVIGSPQEVINSLAKCRFVLNVT